MFLEFPLTGGIIIGLCLHSKIRLFLKNPADNEKDEEEGEEEESSKTPQSAEPEFDKEDLSELVSKKVTEISVEYEWKHGLRLIETSVEESLMNCEIVESNWAGYFVKFFGTRVFTHFLVVVDFIFNQHFASFLCE